MAVPVGERMLCSDSTCRHTAVTRQPRPHATQSRASAAYALKLERALHERVRVSVRAQPLERHHEALEGRLGAEGGCSGRKREAARAEGS